MSRTVFSDQIADYINGHLSPGQAHQLEAAMREDAELAEQVAFERTLQATVRAPHEAKVDALPHFGAVRAHIEAQQGQTRSPGSWLNWRSWTPRVWLTPVLGGLFMVALAVNLTPTGPDYSNDYETLSDTPPVESTNLATLRIVVMPGADLDTVVESFGLEAVIWHPQTNAVDVAIPTDANLTQLQATLEQDPRVRFVSVRPSSHE